MSKIYKAAVSLGLSCVLAATSTFSASAFLEHHIIPNYPCYQQYGQNCWAYTIKSMYDCVTGSTIGISSIYVAYAQSNGSNYVIDAGANLQQSYNVINYLLPGNNPQMSVGALSISDIKNRVNANKPSYIGGYYQDSSGIHGHAVALMGYFELQTPSYLIFYMDPATGEVENCGYMEGVTPHFFISNDVGYSWTAGGTIRLY